jgi:hypothetical protein
MRPCRSHQAAHARLPLPRLFRARVPYVALSSSCSPLSSALLGLADMLSDFLMLATGDAPVSLRSKKIPPSGSLLSSASSAPSC